MSTHWSSRASCRRTAVTCDTEGTLLPPGGPVGNERVVGGRPELGGDGETGGTREGTSPGGGVSAQSRRGSEEGEGER